MPAAVQAACDAAWRAGVLAADLQSQAREERKADDSPVSAADRAADRLIRERLQAATPAYAILSEEAPAPVVPNSTPLWIVDPIDGTRAYLDGGEDWAVQIALTAAGVLQAGVLAIPASRRLLCGLPAAQQLWQWRDGAWTRLRPRLRRQCLRLIASRRLRGRLNNLPEPLATARQLHRSSVGVKVAALIDDEADAYLHTQTVADWDLAAPAAVLLAAGGQTGDRFCRPHRWPQPSGHPDLFWSLLDSATHRRLAGALAAPE